MFIQNRSLSFFGRSQTVSGGADSGGCGGINKKMIER